MHAASGVVVEDELRKHKERSYEEKIYDGDNVEKRARNDSLKLHQPAGQDQDVPEGSGPRRGLDTSKVLNAMGSLGREMSSIRAVYDENAHLHARIAELQKQAVEGDQQREQLQKQIVQLEMANAPADALRRNIAEELGLEILIL
jgi:hypothetical protein